MLPVSYLEKLLDIRVEFLSKDGTIKSIMQLYYLLSITNTYKAKSEICISI